jgi:erythromycin esterase-like protein
VFTDRLARDAQLIRNAVTPLQGASDVAALADFCGDAEFVLIGEATHGTHEFYELRAQLTRRLIADKGFCAVAVEGDWPDTFRVHRYVTRRSDDARAHDALANFRRFPAWMWRNTVVVDFVEWLRNWNAGQNELRDQAGFYGMDLYSMHSSIESVLGYLDNVDPAAAGRARQRYGCFEHFSEEPQAYGLATAARGKEPCEDEVIDQLLELRRREVELRHRDGRIAAEEFFSAEQNARLIMNAERFYRAMFRGRDESWNLRDMHMFETLAELRGHLAGAGRRPRIVVWAHNSHLGDARATQMGKRGEINVGQLVREHFGSRARSIGFTTSAGTVTAASEWGGLAERKAIRRAMTGSYEELFDATGMDAFWFDLRPKNSATDLLKKERLERAIGVLYLPETERWSHYFTAKLPGQFDAIIHFNKTRALVPLERTSEWERGELPETYPSAL